MRTFILWIKCQLAWTWRLGIIRRTTAFRWEMDYCQRDCDLKELMQTKGTVTNHRSEAL